ncbi:hypothetical protein OKA05_01855 [Luteolibacter arcticus]|uniref:Lipoprotein n=1 Tax=Luteolibacter arcticus TaxID=1581411 RepID=A0ABT3GCD7_9BACT|nr:hypothetical protein [Luteolibacter arcticus]MCW1921277.1 hypothetical protein [Luteolibacter arcticus]
MKISPHLLLVVLGSMALSSCAEMAVGLASAALDSAIDRDREKDGVRAHLRHGDTVEEAQRAASDDRFFQEMESTWLE